MKSKTAEKLSPRQLQVLPYLISCSTHEEASRQSGISAKQIYSWLKEPLFEKELNRQRNDVFSNAIRSLKAASQKAVLTLVDCLNDSNTKNRIAAADKILSHTFRGMELFELEERLSRTERLIAEALKKQPSTSEA